MTVAWHHMASEQKALAGALFEALSALDEVPAQGADAVGFGALYAYASEPEQPMTADLEAALRSRPRLAADLRHLLAKGCARHGQRLAAASSGAVSHREGPGFALDIRPSRADASQVYVVIQLSDDEPLPSTLFVTGPESAFHKQALPYLAGDRLQLLFEADAEIVLALQDPTSEVLLR
ncbi:MAG: hypothetical protein AAF495_14670 [Pseudomonadota bacterium]